MEKTEEKTELQSVQQKIKLFDTLLRTSTDGIVITDFNQNIIMVNEAFCNFFGKDIGELAETNLFVWLEQLDGDAPKRWANMEKGVRKEGESRDVEFTKTTNDTALHMSVNASVIERVAEAENGGIVSIWRDVTEKKRAEEALQEREAQLSTILSSSAVGILYAENRKIKWANEAMVEMFGYKDVEEYIGKDSRMFYPTDEEYERVGKAVYESLKGGRDASTDAKFVRKDGSIFDGHVKISAPDPSKPISGTIANLIDITEITERKRAEEALKKSEDNYENLVKNIDDIIYLVDEKGKIKFINDSFERTTGYKIDGLIDKDFMDIIVPESYTYAAEIFKRQLAGEDVGVFELSFYNKRGQIRILEIREKLIWEGNRVVEIHGIGRDITDRKQAEKEINETNQLLIERTIELSQSEERWRTLFETSMDVVYISTVDGRYLDINLAGEELFGYTREELFELDIGKDLYKDPKEREKFQKVIKKDGFVKNYEITFMKKDGIIINALLTATVRKDSVGNIIGHHGIIRDITERKRAEQALRKAKEELEVKVEERTLELRESNKELQLEVLERKRAEEELQDSEAKLNEAQQIAHIGSWSLDYTADAIYQWSDEVYRIFNQTPETFTPTVNQVFELVHSEDREVLSNVMGEAIENCSKELSYEYRILALDGSIRHVLSTSNIVYDKKGIPLRVLGVTQDITERKLAEEALRESEVKLNEAQQVAHIGSWDINYRTDFIYHWSDEMYRIYNQTPETFIPTLENVVEKIHPDDREDFINSRVENFKNQQEKYSLEHRIINPDGSIRYLVSIGNLVYEKDGAPLKISGVTQDITVRKRMEEELIEAQKMKAVGTLAGGIAHDFNNILATVMGYASYLKEKYKDDEQIYNGLNAIEKSTIRASELTEQILAYSRKGRLEIKPFNLNSVIKNVYEIIVISFKKTIDVVLDIDEDLKNIKGDMSQLNQVVLNLVINAKEAMGGAGTLRIETFSKVIGDEDEAAELKVVQGSYSCMKFTDTGHGMDKDVLARIFEPYFSTKSDRTSTGLGMSVVFGIVKGHNGFIGVNSEVDRGTEITIYLPTTEHLKDVKKEDDFDALGGSETILLIDDEISVLKMSERILKDAGYKVFAKSSGREGFEEYEKAPAQVDLVILDVVMPDMAGDEILEKLLKLDPDVKVLLISGYSDKDQHNDLLEMGAADFIGKPFVVNKLLAKIREVLAL